MSPASTRGSLTRSAVSAVPWCWSSTTVPRRTCALTVRPAQLLLSSYEPLSLCTKPSGTSQQCCKTFIATSSSVTCCGQPHFRSPSASEIDSQSAEPRPRPQYSKYTPDGTLICPDYNTRGCSLCDCWNKSLNAVHCCDVWGCSKNTLDGITDKHQIFLEGTKVLPVTT